MVWTIANLMPLCLMMTVEQIRVKKRSFWDDAKIGSMYWLAANMNTEAYLGFNAFNTQALTGQRNIDYIKYRQLIADGHEYNEDLALQVLAKPKEE